ncbi:MAG: ketoacyl-ACP synthase III [Bacteroidia bacterium]|jgi:3-oxoacyl-[acyl-carrier-protein] synthase-3|nr:ketoacyl-ACP synthase III [Bacteroidia bacterium]GIV23861.1 MAG: 3-oxoacyl-[acyl-carrier-protein] synthase 3 [Bacteroidia bacterium]
MRRAAITAVGAYLPEKRLTNADLERLVETSDEWILERTGIKERRILPRGKGSAFMATEAAKDALRKRGLPPEAIDLVIVATVTPEHPFPATANIVADAIGARRAWGFDVEAACSSFLYALSVAADSIAAGRVERALVIGSDKMSSIIDYRDRATCVIFGDAAGAVLLEPTEEEVGVMDYLHQADGSGCTFLHMKAGGSVLPPSVRTVRNRLHYVYQEGRQVFKHAVVQMAAVAEALMKKHNLTADDIAFFVPHQANKRIIEAAAERLRLPMEKVMMNIERYGNTTSATLPLCLYDYEGQLKKGDNLILATFGGGFTWGALWLRWAY